MTKNQNYDKALKTMKNNFFGKGSSEKAKKTYDKIRSLKEIKEFKLGPMNSYDFLGDPKRLGFLFARHKFVAKMFSGFDNVLEIGCQEGLGTIVVAQEAKHVFATDFYKPHVISCKKRGIEKQFRNIKFYGHDILGAPIKNKFDGVFSLDVLEHIDPLQEKIFFINICKSIKQSGVVILGTPSLESQEYASISSKQGHINCKTGEELKTVCKKYFQNVFIFGMNDEVLHTGFNKMCHYLFALCVAKKQN